jgi:ABC-2 type transport system permease protein
VLTAVVADTAAEPTDLVSAPELRLVRGPAAISGDWRRFFRLVLMIATMDYKLTYFGSVLGYVWSFAQPLLFFGVLYLVFAVVLASSFTQVPDFPVLLLMNIVLFSFFVGATQGSVPSLVMRENLVRKMHFPRLVVPLAVVATAGFQLLLNLIVVMGFMVAYGVSPRWTWLFLPLIVVGFAALATGLAMILSSLYVRFRDVAPIWGVVCQGLYFACPIFITIESIAGKHPALARYYLFNPLAALLQQARYWMVGGTHTPAWYMGSAIFLLVPFGLLLATLVGGYCVFAREAPRIAEEL